LCRRISAASGVRTRGLGLGVHFEFNGEEPYLTLAIGIPVSALHRFMEEADGTRLLDFSSLRWQPVCMSSRQPQGAGNKPERAKRIRPTVKIIRLEVENGLGPIVSLIRSMIMNLIYMLGFTGLLARGRRKAADSSEVSK